MQTLVSAWLDSRLVGLARWYTEAHVKSCPQCTASVPFLKSLRFRLSDLGQKPNKETLSETQWEAVEAVWERAEQQKQGQNRPLLKNNSFFFSNGYP